MLTLETILKDTLFVAKMDGWREVGTFEETRHLSERSDCRDYDLCAKQPDHLREFYDAYFAYEQAHCFITVQDFYRDVWSYREWRLTKWNGSKWTLPQGRTSDGESYWRLIAERLAAYENTGLTPDEILKLKGESR